MAILFFFERRTKFLKIKINELKQYLTIFIFKKRTHLVQYGVV